MDVREGGGGGESVNGNLDSAVFLYQDVWGSKTLGGQDSLLLVDLFMMMLIMVIFLRYFLICCLFSCVENSHVVYSCC